MLARANSECVASRCSPTGEAIWQRGFRRCLCGGAGVARSRVSLRAPLSGAQPQAPLSLRQVDPLIRELTQYRDLIQHASTSRNPNHEPDRTESFSGATAPERHGRGDGNPPFASAIGELGAHRLISTLVSDELACRSKRLLERRHKQAQFRDADKRLDNFDFQFNARMNRNLVFELATANWVGKREDALFLVHQEAARVTALRPSGTQSSSRATACYIVKPTHYWKNWRRHARWQA